MQTTKPELSIIIVNFNDKDHLAECLSSIQNNLQSLSYEIIVVDNFSSDGSADMVAARFPQTKLMRNDANLGYPAANNIGIQKSQGDFLLFLNPDTLIYAGVIEGLMGELKNNPHIGGVAPALSLGPDKYQVSFGWEVNFWTELVKKCGLNAYYSSVMKRKKHSRQVHWLSGACLLTRKKAVDEAGRFDEQFFLFFEDIDLCFRMRKLGWALVILPEYEILHHAGSATDKTPWKSRYHYRKSQLYFYKKHCSSVSQVLLKIYLWLNFRLIFFLLPRSNNQEWKKRYFDLLLSD